LDVPLAISVPNQRGGATKTEGFSVWARRSGSTSAGKHPTEVRWTARRVMVVARYHFWLQPAGIAPPSNVPCCATTTA